MATTWDPTNKNSDFVLSGGNLVVSDATYTGASSIGIATTAITTGQKKYWEVTVNATSQQIQLGIADINVVYTGGRWLGENYDSTGWTSDDTHVYNGAVSIATYTNINAGDVVGIAVDFAAATIQFFKNGVSQGAAISHGITGNVYPAYELKYDNVTAPKLTANFGATAFAYTPPAGFTGFDSPVTWTGAITASSSATAVGHAIHIASSALSAAAVIHGAGAGIHIASSALSAASSISSIGHRVVAVPSTAFSATASISGTGRSLVVLHSTALTAASSVVFASIVKTPLVSISARVSMSGKLQPLWAQPSPGTNPNWAPPTTPSSPWTPAASTPVTWNDA